MVTRRIVVFTEQGVSERYEKSGLPRETEEGRSFSWGELVVVALQGIDPDDRTFWMPRADWLLTTLAIPAFFVTFADARRAGMLRRMAEKLPGFSRELALCEARKEDIGRVIVWRRPEVACPRCGRGPLSERRFVRGSVRVLALECPLCGALFDLEKRVAEGD